MKIGNREFDLKNHAYIMGILNITPDSFSDGGNYNTIDAALFHAEQMIKEGADIIDIGGESTRPGHEKISDTEEIHRVVPVIERIKAEFDIPVSLDTYKAEVAKEGIKVGIDLINDIWGLKWDGNMAPIIAESGLPCCLMHNRREINYMDFMNDFRSDIEEILDIACWAGIEKEKIILDPGIGFAKDYKMNLMIMNHLELLAKWEVPILLGTSRKSMIGNALNLPVEEREEGTLATTVVGRMKGCSIFRVHDVKKNKRALMMTEAILQQK
ncbi:MAG: dihydropteroate synthase [Lachnospiraceae bacterium]